MSIYNETKNCKCKSYENTTNWYYNNGITHGKDNQNMENDC